MQKDSRTASLHRLAHTCCSQCHSCRLSLRQCNLKSPHSSILTSQHWQPALHHFKSTSVKMKSTCAMLLSPWSLVSVRLPAGPIVLSWGMHAEASTLLADVCMAELGPGHTAVACSWRKTADQRSTLIQSLNRGNQFLRPVQERSNSK